jgi:N-methylhydantoinase A
MTATAAPWRIGIDTGGTFTDIVAVHGESGRMLVTKVSSTPANPAIGLVNGVREVMRIAAEPLGAIATLSHGTTVATNALLQGAIDGLGLIVTEGFRHLLEIARQSVPDGYGNSYFWVKPERLVPLDLVREVGGRFDFEGKQLRKLDVASVREAARFYKRKGVRAVGVCLMHAYANPAHEQRVREILLKEYPELTVSLSCEVLPEYREYERAMTTLVDAFVKPHMAVYLKRIEAELGADLAGKPFLVMQSSGGVISAKQVVAKPITTALSGPAACSVVAKLAGFENVVTLDAGGTSTDICLIEGGQAHITNGSSIGAFPVRIPMIDIETIGTGGGSIAWISREGHLKVGPKSAGAVPGPMCYPNGGDQPTITDANLVLGRLPAALIGGGIKLDVERARAGLAALADRLAAGPAGGKRMSVEQLAEGIVEIANWNQANCIRQMTIQKGIDPRKFALLSFGGGGPVQSPAVMRLLHMACCIVPFNPGNLSAFGLLAVDWRTDQITTRVTHEDAIDPAALAAIYAKLERDAIATLERDGIARSRCRTVREADIRYVGQSMEVRVPAPAGAIDAAFVKKLVASFHAAHRKAYGYDYSGESTAGGPGSVRQKIEIVNLCVSGFGAIERPQLPKLESKPGVVPARKGVRRAYLDGAWIDTPVYDRAVLPAGHKLEGPSIVEEFGSTTLVWPGQWLEVDAHGIMLIREKVTEIGAKSTGAQLKETKR